MRKLYPFFLITMLVSAYWYMRMTEKPQTEAISIHQAPAPGIPSFDEPAITRHPSEEEVQAAQGIKLDLRSETPSRSPGSRSIEDRLKYLKTLEECENEGSCLFQDSDSREVFFEQGTAMSDELNAITEEYERTGGDEKTLVSAARHFFQFDNDEVREAALKLMAALPADPANVEAISAGTQATVDTVIIKKALKELERYSDQASQKKIAGFLSSILKEGPHFAGQEVAKGLLPLVNDSNIDAFRKTLISLPKRSAKREFLQATLDEWERLKYGA